MPMWQREEIQEMSRRVTSGAKGQGQAVRGEWPLFACLLLTTTAAWAQAPIFPDQIGEYQKSAPKTLTAPDQALYEEYGLDAAESAVYTAPDQKHFTAAGWRLKDSTGALALFQSLRPMAATESKYAPVAAQTPGAVLFLHGNYVFQFAGDRPAADSLEDFYGHLPKYENSPLPVLSQALPSSSPGIALVANSQRYVIGPVSLQRFMPEVPPSTAAFRFGTEAQLGKYKTSKGLLTLAIFDYPTPTMARDQAPEFEKIPQAMVKRTGPLIVVTVAPPDRDAAERLLGKINYAAQVTENTKVPVNEVKGFAGALISMIALAGILICICVIGGIGFGGFRMLRRKLWKSADPDAMITLSIDKTN